MGLWEGIILGARIAQIICALVVLICCAYATSVGFVDGLSGIPLSIGQVNFMIFNSVWTLLVVGYQVFVPRFNDKLGHKFIVLGVDALTTLFWFAGFIALSVFTSVFFIEASSSGVFHALQAACAFGAFAWLAFLTTTVLNTINVFRGNTGSAKHSHGEPVSYPAA